MTYVDRIGPAMVFPLGEYIADEMLARGWTCVDVASRMSGDYAINIGVMNLVLALSSDDKVVVDDWLCKRLSEAFGVEPAYFRNLHETWLRWPNARQPFKCPEELFDGIVFPANDLTPGAEPA